VVDEAAGLQKPQLEKIERLARQAIGLDSRRRDSVQVIMVPFAVHASTEAANAAKPESLRNVDEKPAETMRHAKANTDWPVYAGLALAVLAGVLLVWMRVRHVRSRSGEAAIAQEESVSPGQRFEAELGSVRKRVMEDPKVAASVVKLWMNA
jgi:flagellar biosynthesis/type III secretory pathway M-ring protein FliF/YscJ